MSRKGAVDKYILLFIVLLIIAIVIIIFFYSGARKLIEDVLLKIVGPG